MTSALGTKNASPCDAAESIMVCLVLQNLCFVFVSLMHLCMYVCMYSHPVTSAAFATSSSLPSPTSESSAPSLVSSLPLFLHPDPRPQPPPSPALVNAVCLSASLQNSFLISLCLISFYLLSGCSLIRVEHCPSFNEMVIR
jgi:hypothetical protein